LFTFKTHNSQVEVFKAGGAYPATKLVTLYRKDDFDVEAFYSNSEELPAGTNPWIGRYTIKSFKVPENDDVATIKLKVRINLHGVYTIEQGYTVEEEEKPVEETATPMETEQSAPKDEKFDSKISSPETLKEEKPAVKKVVKKIPCSVVGGTHSLIPELMQALVTKELELQKVDKVVIETAEAKNSLEEYVYDTRNKMDCDWSEYVNQQVVKIDNPRNTQ
jgi:heat shock protein 4